MNNKELAKSYLRQAEERIKHAMEALDSGNYPYVIRQCQEAVELLLKAALRYVGVEPPKLHDVGPVLRRERGRFPEWFREEVDELASYSRILSRERGQPCTAMRRPASRLRSFTHTLMLRMPLKCASRSAI